MRCRTARNLLSLRLDGRLAPSSATSLEAHLVRCPECELAAARLERAWKRLDALEGARRAPDDFARVVASAVARRTGWRGMMEPLLALAPGLLRPAAAVAVAVSVVVGTASGATLGRAAFGRRRAVAPPEAIALSEGFGVLPFGSPAAGLARALAGGAEGRE